MANYRLVNFYDVWGNPRDGWEVNASCVQEENIAIADGADEKEILTGLVNIGFLSTNDRRRVRLDESTYMDAIEVYAVKGRYPLGMLYKKD